MADESPPGSKLVNSVALQLISRFAIIAATAIGLPTAYAMIGRAVSTADTISAKLDVMKEQAAEVNGNIRLIQQTQNAQGSLLADHEIRIRGVEGFVRNNPAGRAN